MLCTYLMFVVTDIQVAGLVCNEYLVSEHTDRMGIRLSPLSLRADATPSASAAGKHSEEGVCEGSGSKAAVPLQGGQVQSYTYI